MTQTSSPLPQRIGPYAISRLIARTDLSEVYEATDARGLRVCVKRLLPELSGASSEVALSFRREAAVLAEVSHPNVVKVIEVGEDGGIPYTCLELVEGRSLSKAIEQGTVPIVEAVRLLKQAASGLERIHEKGIVHADLKPANILLSASASAEELKIADFGLAATSATKAQRAFGTPHYMAPEQTGLVDWPMDARSDLYALGVVAFELLCGKVPFDAQDPAALMLAHTSQKPPDPLTLRQDVPPLLAQMALKLLEKNPQARYRSAHSLLKDLERLEERLRAGDAAATFPLDTTEELGDRLGQVFVGREAELGELEAGLERSRRGRPTAIFLGGRAGVGKSALLREFQNRSISSGARFAAGKCYEFARGLPYYGLAEVLTDFLRRAERLPKEEQERVFGRAKEAVGELGGDLVKIVPAFAHLFPNAKESAYLGEGRDRLRFLQLLGRLMTALAPPGQPLVLLVDDLQWADSGTIQALETFAETLSDCALLLLCTYRDDEVPKDHPFFALLQKAGTKPGLQKIELRPFDAKNTALLVAESLRQPTSAIPQELLTRIHERTEGNPLFVIEVLKALLGSGALAIVSGHLAVDAQKLETTHLPGSVVEVVLRRLEKLPPELHAVLGAAALIGQAFRLPVLAAAANLPLDETYAHVQAAIGQRLLAQGQAGAYRFAHDRIQEACSRLVPQAERTALHGRIVTALEKEGSPEELLFELAEHAYLAKDAARSWRYSIRAGQKAKGRYANDQALTYLGRAIDAASGAKVSAEEVRDVRAQRVEVLDLLGKNQDAIAEYQEILKGELPSIDRARFLTKLAASKQKAGEAPAAKSLLTEALALLGVVLTTRTSWGIVRARLGLFWNLLRIRLGLKVKDEARSKAAVEALTKLWVVTAVLDAKAMPYVAWVLLWQAASLGRSRELAVAHRTMLISLVQLPRPPWQKALGHGTQAVEIARAVEAPLDAAIAVLYTADIYVWSGRYRESLPWLQTARESLSTLGNVWELANAHIFSFMAFRATGRLDEAQAHAQALLELGEKTQAQNTISNASQKIADLLFLRGEVAKGESYLSRSLSIAEEKKLNLERFMAHKIAGAARLREGKLSEARLQFGAAVNMLQQGVTKPLQAYISDAYLGYAEAALKDPDHLAASGGQAGEEWQKVERFVDEALARERTLKGHLGYALRMSAIVQARRGKKAQAKKRFDQALAVLRAQERSLDVAACELELSETLADVLGEEAAVLARKAHAAFALARAKPQVEEAAKLLERLGHPVERAKEGGAAKDDRALAELIEVSQLLMESRDPDALLERIVDSSLSLLGAERGFIFTRETGNAELVLRVGKTANGQHVPSQDAKVSRGVIARVDASGEGLAVSDTEQDETLRERRSIMAFQLRSVLCTPLSHGGEKLGVLYLDSQITQAIFGEKQLSLLRSFAAQAAIALANAIKFRTIEALNRELDGRVLERTRQLETANVQLQASMDELRTTTLRLAEARREALEKELQVARGIQLAMVPPMEDVDLDVARLRGLLVPASFCGGDFWTYAATSERLILVVGDVTGHGVGSAMITTTAKSCIDTLWQEDAQHLSVDRLLSRINDVVYGTAKGGLYMTAFAIEVNRTQRKLFWSVAGHNPQYHVKTDGPNGRMTALTQPSMRLGDGVGNSFPLLQTDYAPGDRLILYTDGVVEHPNAEGAEYGDRRFRRLLQSAWALPPGELVSKVQADLQAFAAGTAATDDVTLVVAELR